MQSEIRVLSPRRKLVTITVSILALCAAVLGWAGASKAHAATLTPVKITVSPIVEVQPLYLAQSKGFFKKNGIRATLVPTTSVSAALPLLVKGDVQFSQSTPTSVLNAVGQGLPLRVVAAGAESGVGAKGDGSGIVVPAGSPIRTLKDLEGKTLNTIIFKGSAEWVLRDVLKKANVDISKVKIVEVGFAQIVAALKAGRIDASFVIEPFRTQVVNAGGRSISPAFSAVSGGKSIATTELVTTASYLKNNKSVVRRVVKAVYQAQAYANRHPEAVIRAILAHTRIEPAVAANVRIMPWSTKIDVNSYSKVWLPQLLRYSQLPTKPDLKKILITKI